MRSDFQVKNARRREAKTLWNVRERVEGREARFRLDTYPGNVPGAFGTLAASIYNECIKGTSTKERR